MFCPNCGNKLEDDDVFCTACGKQTKAVVPKDEPKERLNRISDKFPDEFSNELDDMEMQDYDMEEKSAKKRTIIVIVAVVVIVCLAGGVFFWKSTSESKQKSDTRKVAQDSKKESSGKTDEEAKAETKEDEKSFAWDEGDAKIDLPSEGTENKQGTEKAPVVEHEYTAVVQMTDWNGAKAYCESQGGYLATIETAEEFDLVVQKANEAGLKAVYLGAYKDNGSNEFKWVTGTTFNLPEKWAAGEPNNDKGVENFMGLYFARDTWSLFDIPSDITSYYDDGQVGFVMEKETKK